MKYTFLLPACLLCVAMCDTAPAAAPAGFTETVFVSNAALGSATGMAWAPDGTNRLFVIRKNGSVRVIQNGVLSPTPFVSIPSVYTNSECGLIGICFDPDFLNNRHVYFFVTVSASEQQIIRYTDDNGVGANPTVIVPGLPTAGNNHDGGAIGIGPDGHLYWAIGDLGNGTGVDADLTSLAAKVGRANRFTGQPVDDNPFMDGVGPNNEYIWARGFRNPFTMTFQPRTGALWLNVVGTGYEQIFVVGRGDHGGYNDYENTQPEGFLAPKIVYRTNNVDIRTITASGAVRAGGIATFTTPGSHGFRDGGKITISGVSNSSFNGEFYIRNRLSPTTFSVEQPGPDAVSGGGTATTDNLGGSVTGGCFYESTLFPADYRGNFFFGDYNSGRIVRAIVDGNYDASSVDTFVTGASANVDITTGPDGALYYIGNTGGTVKRLVPTATQQDVIVYPTALNIQEGGRAVFTVRLAQQPTAPVTVTVGKQINTDPNLQTLTNPIVFDANNWDQLQTVEIFATADLDTANGTGIFTVTAPGIAQYDVRATEIDSIVEGAPSTELLYRTGDQVPGEPEGTVFSTFGLPSFDGTSVGFLANVRSEKTLIPAILGGTPTAVLVRKNDPAPGTDGVFSSFRDPVFGGRNYAFIGTLKSGTGGISVKNNDGIWSTVADTLQLIAREGGAAPGANGALFQTFLSIAMPETGSAVFTARLKAGSGAAGNKVTAANDVGLWREIAGTPVLVIRERMSISVSEEDARDVKTFQALRFVAGSEDQQRSFRNDGDLLILVNFSDGSQAIVEAPSDGSPLVVRLLTSDTLQKLGLPSAYTSGSAFLGTFRINTDTNATAADDTALFISSGTDSFSVQVREGDTAPDANGATFAAFSAPAAGGESPTLTFLGTLKKRTGTPAVGAGNDTGLWTNAGGTLRLIAREGGGAPGTNGFFAKFLSFAATPDASPLAPIPFTAKLRTGRGVTAKNNTGLWARDGSGTIWLLQRTGAMLSLPDNVSARVTALSALKATPQTAGQGRAINDARQIIYRAGLGRDGQAIFRVQMP